MSIDENVRIEEDVQDKIVEKIHKEEELDDDENSYNVCDSQSDINEQDAERDNKES
ncbi:MAG: hypothetical protein AB7V56_08750 [Candidatus Nitrosocosmicus sp.]